MSSDLTGWCIFYWFIVPLACKPACIYFFCRCAHCICLNYYFAIKVELFIENTVWCFCSQDYLTDILSNIWIWKQNDILKDVIFLYSAQLISVETKLSTVSSSSDSAGFLNGCFFGENRLCHSETTSESPLSQDYFKIRPIYFSDKKSVQNRWSIMPYFETQKTKDYFLSRYTSILFDWIQTKKV